MRIESAFSRADLDAIAAAVAEAETGSAGEIVPYAVDHSDAYRDAAWRAATLGALLGSLVAAAVHELTLAWLEHPALWIAFPTLAGAGLGYLLGAMVPAVERLLVPGRVVEARVQQRALAAFVEQEVFRTRDRTGILLFLSLRERRVVVLADAGISRRVTQAAWDEVAAGMVAGMRRGEPGAALASAIRRCAGILAGHGVARRPDDRDELSDELRRRAE